MNIGFCLPMDFEVCTHKISIGERERHPKKTRKLNNEYPTQEKKTTLLNVIKYISELEWLHTVCACVHMERTIHSNQHTNTEHRIELRQTKL